MLLNIREK